MNIDWEAMREYRGPKLAVVKNGQSRLRRLYAHHASRNKSLAIGNMQTEFGVEVGGRRFPSVEQAYIAGCYSRPTEGHARIQERIRRESDGLRAKAHWRKAEGAREKKLSAARRAEYARAVASIRRDWCEPWHYEFMLWLWWEKMRQNPKFAARIRSIPLSWDIVEKPPHPNEPDWGALEVMEEVPARGSKSKGRKRRQGTGVWVGKNHFGVIAMECRDAIRKGRAPDIDIAELNRRRIHFFGKRLTFAKPEPIAWKPIRRLLYPEAVARQTEHCRQAGRSRSAAKVAASRANGRRHVARPSTRGR